MEFNIFFLCFNESALIPHAVKHYKKYIKSCNITIYDNESTDNSVELAKSLGCNVISWSSNNILNEDIQIEIRNSCWKNIESGWIIMADMDEFICVTENELLEELNNGTTILKIIGINMIGESKTENLYDIDLQEITKYIYEGSESKNLCFLREKINDMNYECGSHSCNPSGVVNYSSKTYYNRHMAILGLSFFINKMIKRYDRSHLMRCKGWSVHYSDDIEKITTNYNNSLKHAKDLS
jgi:hypothetical protein